jgi:hypothetical protein
MRMFTQSEIEREKYEARLKFQRDQASRLRDAIERGENMGRVQLAERLLKLAPTPREVLQAMAAFEELSDLADRLEMQLAERA